MNCNSYQRQYSEDFDEQSQRIGCQRNWGQILVVVILAVAALGTSATLAFVLYKDALKEKALAEKRKGWAQKWKMVEPLIKKIPLGSVLGFIRSLVVLAIERQPGFEQTNL